MALQHLGRQIFARALEDENEFAVGCEVRAVETLDHLDAVRKGDHQVAVQLRQRDSHAGHIRQGDGGDATGNVGADQPEALRANFQDAFPADAFVTVLGAGGDGTGDGVEPLIKRIQRHGGREADGIESEGRQRTPVPHILLQAHVNEIPAGNVAAGRITPGVSEIILGRRSDQSGAKILEALPRWIGGIGRIVEVPDRIRIVRAGRADAHGANRPPRGGDEVPVNREGLVPDGRVSIAVELDPRGIDPPPLGRIGRVDQRAGGHPTRPIAAIGIHIRRDDDIGRVRGADLDELQVRPPVDEAVSIQFIPSEDVAVPAAVDAAVHDFVARVGPRAVGGRADPHGRLVVAPDRAALIGVAQPKDVADLVQRYRAQVHARLRSRRTD